MFQKRVSYALGLTFSSMTFLSRVSALKFRTLFFFKHPLYSVNNIVVLCRLCHTGYPSPECRAATQILFFFSLSCDISMKWGPREASPMAMTGEGPSDGEFYSNYRSFVSEVREQAL